MCVCVCVAAVKLYSASRYRFISRIPFHKIALKPWVRIHWMGEPSAVCSGADLALVGGHLGKHGLGHLGSLHLLLDVLVDPRGDVHKGL